MKISFSEEALVIFKLGYSDLNYNSYFTHNKIFCPKSYFSTANRILINTIRRNINPILFSGLRMVRKNFTLDESIEDANPNEEVLILGYDRDVSVTVRCSICGIPADDSAGLPGGYANPVCDACDQLAINTAGETPWDGWRPGTEPERSTDIIQLAPDDGENPVYIQGAKCWRRYRFGGWVTRRDAFDCGTIDEFLEKHRQGKTWIHAFNSPRPDGVVLPDNYEELIMARREVDKLREHARTLKKGELTDKQYRSFISQIKETPLSIEIDQLQQQTDPDEIILEVSHQAERFLRESSQLGAFCERYVHDEQRTTSG